ncbi:hypothetical protein CC80DRAFT_571563 [Byssothecium circinans]|uniref:Heterokaryon incompatibility domain-containing protein n=1 Tax=Byssothecium circinans TaxID=147558 RepID=A0A6A5TM26_9PLEO|nr:hypothetical protein CC80DRAFT_571563 [Byssothecium circinans]
MLCETCRHLVHEINSASVKSYGMSGDIEIDGEFSTDSEKIQSGVQAGCYVCLAIRNRELHPSTTDSDLEYGCRIQCHESEEGRMSLELVALGMHIGLDIMPLSTSMPDTSTFIADSTRQRYKAPLSTDDPEAMALAKNYVALRLIDLRANPIRLVENTADGGVNSQKYATLSHCWGPSPTNLRLTTENRDQLTSDITMESLPTTFSNAVFIDSLCILQDGKGSKEDWLMHVEAMKSIYQCALLNIAADASFHSNEGLFRERDPAQITTPSFEIQDGAWKGVHLLYATDVHYSAFKDAPLNQRGWVLQERLLSPRIIRFGKDELSWECSESLGKSERYPNGFSRHSLPSSMVESMSLTNFQMKDDDVFEGLDDSSWRHLIEEYSARKLTYPELDKFAAFAAVAEFYTTCFKERYIAGFVEGSLPSCLLWRVHEKKESSPSPLPGRFRAPSWSWAKVDARIYIPFSMSRRHIDEPHKLLAEVVSTHVALVDPANQFGQLREASITLAAPLSHCHWTTEGDSDKCQRLILSEPCLGIPKGKDKVSIQVSFDSIAESTQGFDDTFLMAIRVDTVGGAQSLDLPGSVFLWGYPNRFHGTMHRSPSRRILMSDFTRRKLPHPDLDKLAALSAIAEYYSTFLHEYYIAGFLEGRLPHALAWMATSTVAAPPPPAKAFRAPS